VCVCGGVGARVGVVAGVGRGKARERLGRLCPLSDTGDYKNVERI